MIKSRRIRWTGHAVCMSEKRYAYRVLVGRLERNKPIGRTGDRWEDES
jgi:hypothetical protein